MSLKNRIIEIDIMKGIAILLVLVGHMLPEGSFIKNVIYTFHIPLFFILSGLVMKENNNDFSIFSLFKNKVFLSYLFWSIIYIAIDLIFRFIIFNQIELNIIIWNCYNAIVLFGINVLWFLSSLTISKYISNIIICKLSKWRGIIIFLIFFLFIGYFSSNLDVLKNSMFGMLLYYPIIAILRPLSMVIFILIGFYSKNLLKKIIEETSLKAFVIAIILISINIFCCKHIIGIIDVRVLKFGNPVIFFVLSLTGSLSILFISIALRNIKLLNNILSYFGVNSLFVMATHNYLMINEGIVKLIETYGDINQTKLIVFLDIGILIVIEYILCKIFGDLYQNIINKIYIKVTHKLDYVKDIEQL